MACQLPITAWHIVIGGFLQDRARNGMVKLWRRLNGLSSPRVRVDFFRWSENWSAIAEQIWQLADDDHKPPTIKIYGYSWGCASAMQLCEQLRKRGLTVAWLVLSDPVYRSTWLLARWLAMTVSPRIHVPANVRSVSWFRQRENRPQGHDLVATERKATLIRPAKLLTVTHQYMDDHPEFHAECERVALL